jgi:hypothetical protein
MLTNFQLEDMADYYGVPLTDVVMKNELNNKVIDANWIINLASAPSTGTHFLGLITRGKQSFYFDSFGAPPPEEIIHYVKQRKGSHLGYNNSIIQDLESSNCGYYSFLFLLYMKNHLKNHKSIYDCADEFIKHFADDTKKNDAILAKLMLNNLPKNKPLHKLIKRLCREKKVQDYA